jgi:hypothetical protein
MEADWEFEVGGDAPVIEAIWPGFVDLQRAPEAVWELPEAAQLLALAEALIKLNSPVSPIWTSKCDFWPELEATDFEPVELDAPASATMAMGCFIDLLPRNDQQWPFPANAAAACKRLCGLLHTIPLRCCRIDLVIRRAFIRRIPLKPELIDLGITAYLTACGVNAREAAGTLQAALAAFTDALCLHSTVE